MRVIALTGNVAAGKSTVVDELRRLGARIIDADAIVHALQRPGEAVFNAIVARFGPGIVAPTGRLNRAALRAIILEDPRAKTDLEAIVHPAVIHRQAELVAQAELDGANVVIIDIPLLFEAADPNAYDGIILVDAPIEIRRQRLMDYRGMTREEADLLIATQIPSERKRERANWIVENAADRDSLISQTEAIWNDIRP